MTDITDKLRHLAKTITPDRESEQVLLFAANHIEELHTALQLLHKEMRWSVSQFTFDRAMNAAAKALDDLTNRSEF